MFQNYSAQDLSQTKLDNRSIQNFSLVFKELPPDPYDPNQTRKRAIATGKLRNFNNIEIDLPSAFVDGQPVYSYQLSTAANPDEHGRERLIPWVKHQDIVVQLASVIVPHLRRVATSWNSLEHGDDCRLLIHLFSYQPRLNCPSLPTPNIVHFDEVGITSITLINRCGVKGGENAIVCRSKSGKEISAVPEKYIFMKRTLHKLFDGIVFDDRLVAHNVTPLIATGDNSIRDIIIIDIDPL